MSHHDTCTADFPTHLDGTQKALSRIVTMETSHYALELSKVTTEWPWMGGLLGNGSDGLLAWPFMTFPATVFQ